MAFEEIHRLSIDRLDMLFRDENPFQHVPLVDLSGDFAEWYALLLGSLAVVIGDEEVVFAQARYEEDIDSARLLVFSTNLVIVVDVTDAKSKAAAVATRTISRRAIRALSVSVSDRHDAKHWGRMSSRWPGALSFEIEYPPLSAPLRFSALAFDRYDKDKTADSVRLLDGLRADLGASIQPQP